MKNILLILILTGSRLVSIADEVTTCNITNCTVDHSVPKADIKASTGDQIRLFFDNLLTTSLWPARWNCGTWTEFHGWLYILSDIGIWGAYFAIPVVLGVFLFKRRKTGLPYPGIFLLFIMFIFSCGLTHFVDALIFWAPVYNFSAFIRFITAVVSIGTVFALVKVAPKALRFKSPEELEKIIEQRTNELKAANNKLGQINQQLAIQINEKERARQEVTSVLESIPQIAWAMTAQGRLFYVNEQWWNYTGIEKSETFGDWKNLFHPEDQAAVWDKWEESLRDSKEYMAEGRLKAADGTYQWFLMRAVPIKDPKNQVQKWIGTSTNINEQKISEQRKDTFLNIASHELRTPLTVIRAYSELIAGHEEVVKHKDLTTYTAKVETHTQKLENLIMELLDVSRIGTGNMHYEMHPEDFDEIIKESLVDFKSINKSGHEITMTGQTGTTVSCDRGKIIQVIHNLLTNAIKYSSEDKPIQITIALNRDRAVACHIRDFGQGIPSEEIRDIFKRFYRASDNIVAGGLGLGLYISDEIIKQHNGKLVAKSEPGKGSEFTFTLPVQGINI